MKIENLTPGQIVYSISRGKMGNTTVSEVRIHPVRVISVDLERQSVCASWNHNQPATWHKKTWSKWRSEPPVLVGLMGKRLATRAEIKAMKEAETLKK